jgi:hypothetical protein
MMDNLNTPVLGANIIKISDGEVMDGVKPI